MIALLGTLPCPVTVQDTINALQAASGDRRMGKITVKPDPIIKETYKMGL